MGNVFRYVLQENLMYAATSIKPSLTAAAAAAKPQQALHAPRAWRGAPAMLALGAAAVLSVWALAQWDASGSTLLHDVQAFQQRVTAGTDTPTGATAAELLGLRYLDTLAPDLRQRISEQVRAEQRAGLTPAGNAAFVMRRLALFEAVLQQSDIVAAR